MTDFGDDIKEIEESIATLRKNPSKGHQQAADDLELKLVRMKHSMNRIEQLSIERLNEWMEALRGDLKKRGVAFSSIDTWGDVGLQTDAMQGLELAWCVSAFRIRDTAKALGFDVPVINAWFASETWRLYVADPGRRANQVGALADLSLSRMANILAIDTNDLEMLKLQHQVAQTVITAGARLPGALPKGNKKERPDSHKQLGEKAAASTVPRRMPAVTVVKTSDG